jgi:uncharacterized protein (TIGR00290 family)
MSQTLLVSWSGGKDSCLALHEILKIRDLEVAALLTTVTRDYNRISMHGVRQILLQRQAESLGIPLREVYITKAATNEEYESRMEEALIEYRDRGVHSVVFGDLFLEDIKSYRDRFLARLGMQGVYPVWKRNTSQFIREFISLGFKARVTCVNAERLDSSFAGRLIDDEFLDKLPPDVDPCGENGEFHTFVFGGPSFKQEIKVSIGEIVFRDGHYYCDLIPN